jgi:DDB1- and CUL4-associated factor 11
VVSSRCNLLAVDEKVNSSRDRRSLGEGQKPSGVLLGHTEGITYVSAKGDGRYVISNGKDQALRLWDLRKMHSSAEFDVAAQNDYRSGFDYRWVAFHLSG